MAFCQCVSSLSLSLPVALAVLFALALVMSAIGFFRVVYFISIGYAFSIVAIGVAVPILFWEHLSWATGLQSGVLVAWGLRLGIPKMHKPPLVLCSTAI